MSGAQVRDVCSFSDSPVVSAKVLLRARGMRILFRDVMERHLQAISVVHVCADFLKGGTAARKKKNIRAVIARDVSSRLRERRTRIYTQKQSRKSLSRAHIVYITTFSCKKCFSEPRVIFPFVPHKHCTGAQTHITLNVQRLYWNDHQENSSGLSSSRW